MITKTCERTKWSNLHHSRHERYDAWADALRLYFGNQDVGKNPSGDFAADIQSLSIGEFRVVECICDPCLGERGKKYLGDQPESLAIQLVLAGKESFEIAGSAYTASAGDLIVWDNVHEVKFNVLEKLHKVSAIFPLARFREWMPSNWDSINRQFVADSPNAFLMRSHLLSLLRADYTNVQMSESALTDATIALLLGTGQGLGPKSYSLGDQRLDSVKSYIEENLKNADLSLSDVAKANQISLRYLHWLFRDSGETAQKYIINCRLDRCRQDIGNPAMADKLITQIAFSWGFSDSAHFSKRFKAAYGASPSEYRERSIS